MATKRLGNDCYEKIADLDEPVFTLRHETPSLRSWCSNGSGLPSRRMSTMPRSERRIERPTTWSSGRQRRSQIERFHCRAAKETNSEIGKTRARLTGI